MFGVFNADAMYKRAVSQVDSQMSKMKDKLTEQIQNAASKGDFELHLELGSTQAVEYAITILTPLGFTVDKDKNYGVKVSWTKSPEPSTESPTPSE